MYALAYIRFVDERVCAPLRPCSHSWTASSRRPAEVVMLHRAEKQRPRSPRHIDLDRGYEVRFWTRQLGCSAEELHTALGKVGSSPAAI